MGIIIKGEQKIYPNFESVNVCVKCRKRNLHYDAVKAGYRKCPTCLHEEYTERYN